MTRTCKLCLALLAFALLCSMAASAQTAPAPVAAPTPVAAPAPEAKPAPTAPAAKPEVTEVPHYFHLNFVVKEVEDGKVTNSRSYSTIIAVHRPGSNKRDSGSLRSGYRVSIATGSFGSPLSGGGTAPITQTQYQYIDVGVSIDVENPLEFQNQLALDLRCDVTNSPGGVDTNAQNPIIRQVRWNSSLIVPIGKPTTVFSSDDVSSKKTLQLELTATPIR